MIRSRRLRAGWGTLALAAALAAASASAQPSQEYELKAAFIYNFAAFVEWPPQAFRDADSPFVIGVVGHDPFGAVLDDIVRGEQAKNRPLIVRRLRSLEEIGECHILFVSESERHRLHEILRHARSHAVLTVSDLPGFAAAGGMIGFDVEGNRLVLQVNAEAAADAELVISSKLLRVARVISERSRGA